MRRQPALVSLSPVSPSGTAGPKHPEPEAHRLLGKLDADSLVEAVKAAVLAQREDTQALSSGSQVFVEIDGMKVNVADYLLRLGRREMLLAVRSAVDANPHSKPRLIQELQQIIAGSTPPPPPARTSQQGALGQKGRLAPGPPPPRCSGAYVPSAMAASGSASSPSLLGRPGSFGPGGSGTSGTPFVQERRVRGQLASASLSPYMAPSASLTPIQASGAGSAARASASQRPLASSTSLPSLLPSATATTTAATTATTATAATAATTTTTTPPAAATSTPQSSTASAAGPSPGLASSSSAPSLLGKPQPERSSFQPRGLRPSGSNRHIGRRRAGLAPFFVGKPSSPALPSIPEAETMKFNTLPRLQAAPPVRPSRRPVESSEAANGQTTATVTTGTATAGAATAGAPSTSSSSSVSSEQASLNASLREAVRTGAVEAVKRLIAQRADVDSWGDSTSSPRRRNLLALALVQGCPPDILSLLLESGASTSQVDGDGRSLGHLWAWNLVKSRRGLQAEELKLVHLQTHAVNLNMPLATNGNTPLHTLAIVFNGLGELNASSALGGLPSSNNSSDSNSSSSSRSNALGCSAADALRFMQATRYRLQLLVNAKADPNVVNKDGRRPIDLIADAYRPSVPMLLGRASEQDQPAPQIGVNRQGDSLDALIC